MASSSSSSRSQSASSSEAGDKEMNLTVANDMDGFALMTLFLPEFEGYKHWTSSEIYREERRKQEEQFSREIHTEGEEFQNRVKLIEMIYLQESSKHNSETEVWKQASLDYYLMMFISRERDHHMSEAFLGIEDYSNRIRSMLLRGLDDIQYIQLESFDDFYQYLFHQIDLQYKQNQKSALIKNIIAIEEVSWKETGIVPLSDIRKLEYPQNVNSFLGELVQHEGVRSDLKHCFNLAQSYAKKVREEITNEEFRSILAQSEEERRQKKYDVVECMRQNGEIALTEMHVKIQLSYLQLLKERMANQK